MANIPCLRKVQVIIDLLDRTYISISSENHWSPNNVKERHFSASENTTRMHDEKKIYIFLFYLRSQFTTASVLKLMHPLEKGSQRRTRN